MFTFPDRCKLFEYKGTKIFLMDFSGLNVEAILAMIPECKKYVSHQIPNSIMTITDVTDARFSQETTDELKDLAASNKPYVIASSVVGVAGMRKIVYDSIVMFTGRKNMKRHSTREEAFKWLSTFCK